MKKKFLSLLLAICMIIPCVFILNACGSNSKNPISQAKWEDTFENCSFEFYANNIESQITVTKNSYSTANYEKGGTEYIREINSDEKTYYSIEISRFGKPTTEKTPISANEYVYGRECFEPILNFVKDNYSNFKYNNDGYFLGAYYETNVSGQLKEKITELCGLTKDKYLFLINYKSNNGGYSIYDLQIIDGSFVPNKEYRTGAIATFTIDVFYTYSFYFKDKSLKDLSDFNVDYKIIGGTGVNYMEIYFTKNAVRFYTPNQNDMDGYVDGIYYNDNGTYKYYKKDMSGVWSESPSDEETYNNVKTQYFNMFGGGKIFEKLNDNAIMQDGKLTPFWNVTEIKGGQSGLQEVIYTDFTFDFDDGITGGSWKLKLHQDFGDITTDYGTFTMTVCDVTIDIPTV